MTTRKRKRRGAHKGVDDKAPAQSTGPSGPRVNSGSATSPDTSAKQETYDGLADRRQGILPEAAPRCANTDASVPDGSNPELDRLVGDANSAAAHISGRYSTFIIFVLYFAITVGNTTDEMLLRESDLPLPLLAVGLPIKAFFMIAPAILIALHMNLLLKLTTYAKSLDVIRATLETATGAQRAQLGERVLVTIHPFPFGHFYLDTLRIPRERALAWCVVVPAVVCPALLLLATQRQFLPYHSLGVTWLHRIYVVADLVLLFVFWGPLSSRRKHGVAGELSSYRNASGHNSNVIHRITAVIPLVLSVVISFILLAIPGECRWMDRRLYGQGVVEEFSDRCPGEERHAHDHIEIVTRRIPGNIIGRMLAPLVHRDLDVSDRTLVAEGAPAQLRSGARNAGERSGTDGGTHIRALNLRGRDLRFANFANASLFDVDMRQARLRGACFNHADLRGADLQEAQMQGAYCASAKLQHANLTQAQLQGADFRDAQLQCAQLVHARMEAAELSFAWLQGADLSWARLSGARLWAAQLQGATLRGAWLQGADLSATDFLGADLTRAGLQGADMDHANLAGASLYGANLCGARLNDCSCEGQSVRIATVEEVTGPGRSIRWYETGLRYGRPEGPTYRIPAALATNIDLGNTSLTRLRGDSDAERNALVRLANEWIIPRKRVEGMRWISPGDAIWTIEPVVGAIANSLVETVYTGPTVFAKSVDQAKGSRLSGRWKGVYIDEDTLSKCSEGDGNIPPGEVFSDACTGATAIEERARWKFPDGAFPEDCGVSIPTTTSAPSDSDAGR